MKTSSLRIPIVATVVTSILLLLGFSLLIGTAAPPPGYNSGQSTGAPYSINVTTGSILTDTTYGSLGGGSLTVSSSNASNLSVSQGTCIVTSVTGVLGVTSVAGSYVYTTGGSSNGGQPVYIDTGPAFAIWNTTVGTIGTGSNAQPAYAWVISGTNTIGQSINSGQACLVSGTSSVQYGTLNGATYSGGFGLGSGTASSATLGPAISSGASQPCSRMIITSTASGCLLGTGGTSPGIFPVPSGQPVYLPVSNVNQLSVSGTGAVEYLWVK